MLRARSGSAPEPPPADAAVTPVSEIDEAIVAAQAELLRAVQLGGLQDDPLRHVIYALSLHLGTLHKLLSGAALTIGTRIEQAKLPINNEEMRRAVIQGINTHAGSAVRVMGWRNLIFATLATVGIALVAFGGGYWFRGATPVAVQVHAGAEKCEDRPDGSRLCWIPVFERLPAVK